MLTGPYRNLYHELSAILPDDRLIHDELRTLCYGTDASFYRLIPRLVVRAESEQEVLATLRACHAAGLPVTFRAGGTSLSGQAISDSVLLVCGHGWTQHSILDAGNRVTLGPGVIGAHANVYLAPYGRKIGPDPASINSAMIGGIAANNASGMCCGTAQNSYNTLDSLRIIFADGSVLDTATPTSRAQFVNEHRDLIEGITALANRVNANPALAERIRHKYKMKNTTGYSLNALVDFTDPVDIIAHLLIGSEGTLGFISSITFRTVQELPHKATSLMLFPDIRTACAAVTLLKSAPVDAVELMDRASLRSVEAKPGMPSVLHSLGPDVAALLVETRAADPAALQNNIERITASIADIQLVEPVSFTTSPAEGATLWNIRKGLFPSVGAMRATGTTVIIEDVAFPLQHLAQATLDLRTLFARHGYQDAIIFGHALEGNLHFVFNQDFNSEQEVARYRAFMDDVTAMVVRKYDGSLKAEHGTGRNMAPFVGLEWGEEALGIMRDIKTLFDPRGILNPGVILNADATAHVRDLKPMPAAHELIDKCIECGFCEVQCPSRNLTLTPRQRIVAYREMQRLRAARTDPARLQTLSASFAYEGDATCATDGLCATSCPVSIDTGKLVKELRAGGHSPLSESLADVAAGNMAALTRTLSAALTLVDVTHRLLGTRFMNAASSAVRKLSGNRIPLWNPHMPAGAHGSWKRDTASDATKTVVYFPTCINRTMGPARTEHDRRAVPALIMDILRDAGWQVLLPDNIEELCCGMAFTSKGFRKQGEMKSRQLEAALRKTSQNGKIPILVDMSPCWYQMHQSFTPGLTLYEPVRFLLDHVLPDVPVRRLPETVAIHTTCSSEKMGLGSALKELAGRCADTVIVPHAIGCCGWAGDRGFTVPELNDAALEELHARIPEGCTAGYSNSRTCEIGLSLHSGIPYRSIASLVDRAMRAARTNGSEPVDGKKIL